MLDGKSKWWALLFSIPPLFLIVFLIEATSSLRNKDIDPEGQSQYFTFWEEVPMLRYALGFFVFALIAAFLGFSGMALAAAGIAKILFFIFLVLFVCTMVGHLLRRA